MSVGKVYIVRHGNTFDKGDVVLRVGGRTDLPLSTSGLHQAKQLAHDLRDVSFQAAYCSNLKRTCQTAEVILGNRNFELAAFLKEVDYGPDEGCAETEVISRVGTHALNQWDLHSIPPPVWRVDVHNIRRAWNDFLAKCPRDRNTLVVTSNGIARFVLDIISSGDAVPRKLRTGAYGVISLGSKGPTLLSWDVRPNMQ